MLVDVQTAVWDNFALPAAVNALHVQHMLDTFDQRRTPPAVQSLQVNGKVMPFGNNGWRDAHSVAAAWQPSALDVRLVMNFNDDDDSVDTLSVLFERRAGVQFTECYQPEAMKARCCMCRCLHRSVPLLVRRVRC